MAEALAVPGTEAFREYVLAGMCPFCGLGPYHVLATHVGRAHAVDGKELREMAGLCYHASITSPEYHSRRSVLASNQWENVAEKMEAARTERAGRPRNLSPAAKELNLRNLQLAHRPEIWEQVGRKNSESRIAAAVERDTAIASRYRDGATLKQIATEFDIATVTVRAALLRAGLWNEDGRARYHSSRRGKDDPVLVAGRKKHAERQRARSRALVEQLEGGATVQELAAQEGVTVKSMATRLRKNGADIPDGRTTKAIPMVTFACPVCGEETTKVASQVRANRKTSSAGPFCGLSCAAKYRMAQRGRDTSSRPPENTCL